MQESTVYGALSWFRSTACTGGNCIEAAPADGGTLVALRDSKRPDTVLMFSASAWNDFLDGVAEGDFDVLGDTRD
jgi:hypothetical protein